MERIAAYKNKMFCQIVTLEDLKTHFVDYKFNKIFTHDTVIKFEFGTDDTEYAFCAEDVPMTIAQFFKFQGGLYIEENYAKEHFHDIKEIALNLCKTTQGNYIDIDSGLLVDDQIIDAICQNPNIKTFKLGSEQQPFVLTGAIYQKFKNAGKEKIYTDMVSEELKEVFDPIIDYTTGRSLVHTYSYEELLTEEMASFYKGLNDEELFYLKYLNKNCKVSIACDNLTHSYRLIERLKEVGHTGEITLSIKNNNKFNEYVFQNLEFLTNYTNLSIVYHDEKIPIQTYIQYENQLLAMVAPAQQLSPFEKYLYAYNVTKQYKKYNESPRDLSEARSLYKILNNEYMVCAGYSNLLGDFLYKLGIDNSDLSVNVDIMDHETLEKNNDAQDKIKMEDGFHARRKIHLVDPKYGIDGYYFADPTWDNNLEKDFYTCVLLTGDEYNRMNFKDWFQRGSIAEKDTYEVLFSHNIDEYYQILLSKIEHSQIGKTKIETKSKLVTSLMEEFESLDPAYYQALVEKYPNVKKYKPPYQMTEEHELNQIVYEIGEHILEKVNHPVSGNQFKEAITTVYKECYGMKDPDTLEQTINEVMQLNAERYRSIFPPVHMIDQNGNEYVDVLKNKFEQAMNVEHKTM